MIYLGFWLVEQSVTLLCPLWKRWLQKEEQVWQWSVRKDTVPSWRGGLNFVELCDLTGWVSGRHLFIPVWHGDLHLVSNCQSKSSNTWEHFCLPRDCLGKKQSHRRKMKPSVTPSVREWPAEQEPRKEIKNSCQRTRQMQIPWKSKLQCGESGPLFSYWKSGNCSKRLISNSC